MRAAIVMVVTLGLLLAVVSTEVLAKGGKGGKKARELAAEVKDQVGSRIPAILKESQARAKEPEPTAQAEPPQPEPQASAPPSQQPRERSSVARVLEEAAAAVSEGEPDPAVSEAFGSIIRVPGKTGTALAWLAVAGGAALFLLVSVLFARAARRPPRVRGGSVGRAKASAHRVAPPGPAEALAALEAAKLGKLVASTADAHVARVSIHPRRRGACGEIEAFLTGAFESAWGRDVTVEHLQCSKEKKGNACDYVVRPVLTGSPVSLSGPRVAAAYSPGWSFEPDRSPQALPDVASTAESVPRTGTP